MFTQDLLNLPKTYLQLAHSLLTRFTQDLPKKALFFLLPKKALIFLFLSIYLPRIYPKFTLILPRIYTEFV